MSLLHNVLTNFVDVVMCRPVKSPSPVAEYLSSLSTATPDDGPVTSAELPDNTTGLTGYFNLLRGPTLSFQVVSWVS